MVLNARNRVDQILGGGSTPSPVAFRAPSHDFDGPAWALKVAHPGARVATVYPDVAQVRRLRRGPLDQVRGPIPIADVRGMHHDCDGVAGRVNKNMPLSSVYLFAPVITADPPFSVVLTLWESTMPADASGARPSRVRHIVRRASCMRSNRPFFDHRLKQAYTASHCGNVAGSILHEHPFRTT